MSRRAFLRRVALGAGTIAVVGAGALGYRAYDQGVLQAGDGPAYAPWEDWRDGPGLRALVAGAILAPSSHNAQPWLFGLGRHHVDVHADPERGVGAIDPFRRELYTGLGACLENLVLAARAGGYEARVELMPGGRSGAHAARVRLAPGPARPSGLYAQIPRRRTNRYAFVAGKDVPRRALVEMSALTDLETPDARVFWFTSPADRGLVGELLVEATEAIVADPAQSRSDHAWFRQDWDEIQRERDGITVDAAGLPEVTAALAKLLPPQSEHAAGEAWVRATRDRHTRTAAAYGIVAVRDAGDDRQRLQGGRLLQRVHLWTTGHGLALHHMNQLSQRGDREVQLGLTPRFGDALAGLPPSGWEVLSTFRVGYPTRAANRSPRRSVDAVIAS